MVVLLVSGALVFSFRNAFANGPESPSRSHSADSFWITPGFYSLHFNRNAGLNDSNPGLGLQWDIAPQWSLAAGRFSNSNDRPSNYLGAIFMPWSWGAIRAGGVLAAFDGYPNMHDGGWFASAIPTIGFYGNRFALNVGIIPEIKERVHGAVSLQLLIRLR